MILLRLLLCISCHVTVSIVTPCAAHYSVLCYYVLAQREERSVAHFTTECSQPQKTRRSSTGQDQEAGMNFVCQHIAYSSSENIVY